MELVNIQYKKNKDAAEIEKQKVDFPLTPSIIKVLKKRKPCPG
jgi:hypothetical protein